MNPMNLLSIFFDDFLLHTVHYSCATTKKCIEAKGSTGQEKNPFVSLLPFLLPMHD